MSIDKGVSTLTVPADSFYLPVVRNYVGQVARSMGFSEKDIYAISLATAEACANVIQHAYLPGEEATFDVICEVYSLGLKVIIRDRGLPFSVEQVKKFSIDDVLEGKSPSGLGLFLMEKNADGISFHNLGLDGKEVHLVKFIHRRRIEDYFDKSKLNIYEQPKSDRKKPIEKIACRIELMKPSQAIEISQCAYRTYGYNYISDFIYYPDRVVEMNKRGELISAVAIAEKTGEVMGHAALEIDAVRELPELGVAFTKPQFRNQGCFNSITDYLLSKAKDKKEKGVYARAVTAHPYSQKALLKNGFRECGVVVGLAPETLFQKLQDVPKQRESVVVLFRNVGNPSMADLYAPVGHKKMLKKIYDNIEIPVNWLDVDDVDKNILSGKRASVNTTVSNSLMNAVISVEKYGYNVIDEISLSLKRLSRERLETIQLYLNLQDPFTVLFSADFEKLGFFFGGILPARRWHNLILQYLNNIVIDYGKVSIASSFGEGLLCYIKECDPGSNL
ncbi:MAG: ATP-binding protein [Candidatus Omnitrophica bacterium]|nr:ATP-binding protein [Candidatus Omnitrophota bacterium]